MVNLRAVRVAVLASVALVALFFAGAVLRFATRIASYAALVLFAIAVGYAIYELYAGWDEAAETNVADQYDVEPRSNESATAAPDRNEDDAITDDELDRELEQLRRERESGQRETELDAEG